MVCKILKYENSRKVLVRFLDTGFETWTISKRIRDGKIKDLLAVTVEDIGYLGEGRYSRKANRKEYVLWKSALNRCKPSIWKTKAMVSYLDCSVHPRWHSFQNFCEDIHKLPNWNTPGFELDKDLRKLGNKVYGPSTCWMVPSELNKALMEKNSGLNGVRKVKTSFHVRISRFGKETFLGAFEKEISAVRAYTKAKKVYLLTLLTKYRNVLSLDIRCSIRTLCYELDLH